MLRQPLDLVLGVVLVLLGAPTVVRLIGDHGRTYAVLAAAVVPLVVIPLVGFGLILLQLGRTKLAVVAALLVILNAAWLAPLYVPDTVHDGQPLTVMTANLRVGLADAQALVQQVRDRRVDVLATEELTPEAVQRLRDAGLEELLPHSELSAASGAEGSGLWSRYPLLSLPAWQLRFQAPGAIVRTPGGDLVVRVVHPFPTLLAGGGGTYRRDYAALTRQVQRLDALPTVLAGDFNASRDNLALRRLMGSRFRDSAEVAGEGVLRTWSPSVSGIPLLHLDHVLVDDSFDARSTAAVSLVGSDHLAVVAELVLR